MLASFYFRQTSRQVVRASLSTSPYPKSSEAPVTPGGTPLNYPTQKSSTNNEKLEPIASNDLLDAKRSNTIILPGVPIAAKAPPLATEQPRVSTSIEHPERPPASRFTAFLRSISSGLPFFPSQQSPASAMDLATTREHFLPVGSS